MPNDSSGFHPTLALKSAIPLAWEAFQRENHRNPSETDRRYWDLIFYYVFGEFPKPTAGKSPGVQQEANEVMVKRGDHDPHWERLLNIMRAQRAEWEFRIRFLPKTPPS